VSATSDSHTNVAGTVPKTVCVWLVAPVIDKTAAHAVIVLVAAQIMKQGDHSYFKYS
jgi:hypothetical protein